MPSSRTISKLCRLREVIGASLDQELRLEDLSLEVDLSAWHVLRSFRDAFKETPHEFITRLRIDRAKDLLTVTDRSVTEICFAVGFNSLGSFSTLFRKRVGLSPAAFRRQVRTWVSVPGLFPWAYVPICFGRFYGPVEPRPTPAGPLAT